MQRQEIGGNSGPRQPNKNDRQPGFIISSFFSCPLWQCGHLATLSSERTQNQLGIKINAFLVCLLCYLAERLTLYGREFNQLQRIKSLTWRHARITRKCLAVDFYATRIKSLQK